MEADFIAWLQEQSETQTAVFGDFTDDAAIIDADGTLVVTTDAITEDVDFILDEETPEEIGFKAVMVNASDIAAMGAYPTHLFVNLVIPSHWSLTSVKSLYAGIQRAAMQCNCKIAGGDFNAWNNGLVVTVTMHGSCKHNPPILRSTAKPGDLLCVSGPLGGSILGHHLSFAPRIGLLNELSHFVQLSSAMDISDGLSSDLHRLCKASNVGAILESQKLPISEAARRLADRDGSSPIEHALNDGEDFELLFTIKPHDFQSHPLPKELGRSLLVIGEITEEKDLLMCNGNSKVPLESLGFMH